LITNYNCYKNGRLAKNASQTVPNVNVPVVCGKASAKIGTDDELFGDGKDELVKVGAARSNCVRLNLIIEVELEPKGRFTYHSFDQSRCPASSEPLCRLQN